MSYLKFEINYLSDELTFDQENTKKIMKKHTLLFLRYILVFI